MTGWDEKLCGWSLPWPVNLHDHYRFADEMMQTVIPEAALRYRYATAMPNFGKDRIRRPQQALAYRERVLAIGRKVNSHFDCNVPGYLEPDTSPEVVREGFEKGAWIAYKLYPRGATTGSSEGVDFNELERLDSVFHMMNRLGMTLLIHGEPTHDHDGTEINVFEREERSIAHIEDILKRHRGLKVVFEHISSSAAAYQVLIWSDVIGHSIDATVAPQYLVWNVNELFRGGMNPAKYSIPALKWEKDRKALVDFITARGRGFMGTDSAPHPVSAKSKPEGCFGGVFNNPVALLVYFQVFKNSGLEDWFRRFVDFACFRGPQFYGLPVETGDALIIREKPWKVPSTYGVGNNLIIPMYAGQELPYTLERQ